MSTLITTIAASLLAFTAASASAADFPKSGSTKATGYETSVTVDALDGWEADMQPDVFVQTGILRNEKEGGPFDKNVVRCIGQEAMVSGTYATSGTCTETDKDGDKIFITFTAGAFTYVSGTGKYKGITGGGTAASEIVFQSPKTVALVTAYEKHWEIK
jgi:hypothetical protein